MIYQISGEQPFQVLSDSFSVSPSQSGYDLYLSADGFNYSRFATVASGTTKQFTGMNNGNYYILSGNTSDVKVNWERECGGGGGGAAGVSSLDGQTGALTTKTIGGQSILGTGDIPVGGGSNVYYVDGDSINNYSGVVDEIYHKLSSGETAYATVKYDYAKYPVAKAEIYEYQEGQPGDPDYLRQEGFQIVATRFGNDGFAIRSGVLRAFRYEGRDGDGYTCGTSWDYTMSEESGGDYVVVEDLSAITSPTNGMIAYVPAHNETFTGYTISNADGNLYGQVYLKHYNPREHSMMVYEQYDEGFISVTQGMAAYGFGNDDVFRYIYRSQVALKYDDTNKLFTILYKPGRFQMQIGVSQEYYSETSGSVQVPAQMYIYKYGKWRLYEDGKISYYLNTISEAEYDEMYQDIPQMGEGEVQFIVDWYNYGWSTYRFQTNTSVFSNGSFYGHTFDCKASNGETFDNIDALSIRVGWSSGYKEWYFAKYSLLPSGE